MLTHPELMGGGLQAEGGQHICAAVERGLTVSAPRAAAVASRAYRGGYGPARGTFGAAPRDILPYLAGAGPA